MIYLHLRNENKMMFGLGQLHDSVTNLRLPLPGTVPGGSLVLRSRRPARTSLTSWSDLQTVKNKCVVLCYLDPHSHTAVRHHDTVSVPLTPNSGRRSCRLYLMMSSLLREDLAVSEVGGVTLTSGLGAGVLLWYIENANWVRT